MDRQDTAVVSKNMFGDQAYQHRARQALPILVRQALAGKPIFYEELATELGMPNPRNLNFPLGSVGQTLIELGREWGLEIPPIQCLVINQAHRVPGEGFGWFMPDPVAWKRLTKLQRRNLVEGVFQQIYAFPKWLWVLEKCGLAPVTASFDGLVANATRLGGGEGPDHKRLKEYVRLRPEIVGVSRRAAPGAVEEPIPSGDSIDVFFDAGQEWVGVEVKPAHASVADITRGLFQCVKYQAVLRAMAIALQRGVDARAVLVLGGALPTELVVLRTMLGVEVFENVRD